ncbi:hypothetical protein H310_14942, partial [Aphanomyces invadans]
MCNPIEGCFSSLKSKIKSYLAMRHRQMMEVVEFATLTQARMALLEAALQDS